MALDKNVNSKDSVLDNLPASQELLETILGIEDEDERWRFIAALQTRGEQATFEKACEFCFSENAHDRQIGVDILGQLGLQGTPPTVFHEPVVIFLLDLLTREQDPGVLYSIGSALGHRKDPRSIEPLLSLSQHSDTNVRFGVVNGLTGLEDERAIEGLMKLSHDENAMIRDWSTFALGSQINTDTPALRNALYERLKDQDQVVRGEAMVGLARRLDRRVLGPLRLILEQATPDTIENLELEAATIVGDASLCPALIQLEEKWPPQDKSQLLYETLEEAISACSPTRTLNA